MLYSTLFDYLCVKVFLIGTHTAAFRLCWWLLLEKSKSSLNYEDRKTGLIFCLIVWCLIELHFLGVFLQVWSLSS